MSTDFFEAGTTAFPWELPAHSMVLSKAREENWTLVLPLVRLIDELLFSQGVPTAALLLPSPACSMLGGDSAPFSAVLCPAV